MSTKLTATKSGALPSMHHATETPERVATERLPATATPEARSIDNALAPRRSYAKLVVLLILAVLAGGGWLVRDRWWPQVKEMFSPSAKALPPGRRSIPVVTAPVSKRNLSIYLNGLGTVTALKTVTVRSRVEGELIKVAFTEGKLVKEGDLLAEIDPRPYEAQRDQAAGQLARDEATLKVAQLTLDRLNSLAKSQAVSTQDVDNQVALVQQTEGTIKADQAMLANAELQVSYCKILSPISGRVGLRLVDVGNIVRANEANGLVVITQLQPIAIVFTISQDDIRRVQEAMGENKDLIVEAYDRDFSHKLATGHLVATDNQVDSTTGTLRLKAVVEEDAASLFPNQFVNTRLLVDTRRDALVVPSSAVQRGPNMAYVYVVKADETVELRKVTVGPSEGTETCIEQGLDDGEIVVTEGLDKLQPGATVSLRDTPADAMKNGPLDGVKDSSAPASESKPAPAPTEAKAS